MFTNCSQESDQIFSKLENKKQNKIKIIKKMEFMKYMEKYLFVLKLCSPSNCVYQELSQGEV